MEPQNKQKLMPLATKVTIIVLLVILVNTIVIGVISYGIHRTDAVQASQEKAISIAQTASMSIVPSEFRNALETGEKNDHYMFLEEQFLRIKEAEHLAFFYAGSFDPVGVLHPDGDIDNSTGETMIVAMRIYIEGTLFDLNGAVRNTMFEQPAFDAFEKGVAQVTEPYIFNVNNRPGIAAYAPIFDEVGKPIGLIGVLMNIDDVLARSTNFARLMFVVSLVIFLAIIWIPIGYLRRSVARPLTDLQTASNNITQGKMDVDMPVRESNDEVGLLSKNFHTMQGIVFGIQNDIRSGVENALDGNLSYRAESDKYTGEWQDVIAKFNDLMDTIARPIDDVSVTLQKIAGGDFDARIEGEYKGDFDKIKKSVNSTAVDLDKYLTDKEDAEHEAHRAELAKGAAEAVSEAMLDSARYANKIQRNLLPQKEAFDKAFSDYSIIWKPRDIVGGDFYWLKNFDKGTVFCLCDCTGHGTPGALLTMLVASTLETLVSEQRYTDTAEILYMLDNWLATVLNAKVDDVNSMEINDGCDLVVMYISNEGDITMSAGNINVFACDGKEVFRYRGQQLFVGEGRLKSKDEVEVVRISANPDNKFYVSSDGLSDQIGGELKKQFGYKTFEEIILENHNEKQEVISEKIWDAFEEYRGDEARRDDFELITFKP